MPIIRRVYEIKGTKVISLPKSWFEWIRRQTGCEVKEVAIEVNDELVIRPIIAKKEGDPVEKHR